jgi:hypothetical protein
MMLIPLLPVLVNLREGAVRQPGIVSDSPLQHSTRFVIQINFVYNLAYGLPFLFIRALPAVFIGD